MFTAACWLRNQSFNSYTEYRQDMLTPSMHSKNTTALNEMCSVVTRIYIGKVSALIIS